MSMSHVDDGTLHAYLDGELAPAEAQGVDAHLAQCPACRGRVEEERALISRAGELLALAAPPERAVPPFRAGDIRPLKRLWWRARLPLAWAATVVLALGIGTYLGSGSRALMERPAAAPQPDLPRDLVAADTPARRVRQESPAEPRVAKRAAREEEDRIAPERKVKPAAATLAPPPQAGIAMFEDGRLLKRSPIGVDSARALLGADPFAVPGAPIHAIYQAREIGYSAVVIVEQTLDSTTAIEVTNARPTPLALDGVAVTGAAAPASRADSVGALERAPRARAQVASSLAAKPSARLMADETLNQPLRRVGTLEIHISGPLPSDSLQKLLRLVQPVKP